jgi:formate-dependent nitrite reductase membrane component NrfD
VIVLLAALGRLAPGGFRNIVAPAIALAFTGLTGLLLIGDLKRPDRFYFLFTKPNPRSWLVRGSYIIVAYSGIVTLWLAAGVLLDVSPGPLLLACGALGVAAAGYTAFLFAQAKGRDIWQSPLLLWHLLSQASLGGSAILIVAGVLGAIPAAAIRELDQVLLAAIVLVGAMTAGEIWTTHESEEARLAWETLTHGAMSARFWLGFVAAGVVLPVVLLALALSGGQFPELSVAAAIVALFGLLLYEDLWRQAGQAVPLS